MRNEKREKDTKQRGTMQHVVVKYATERVLEFTNLFHLFYFSAWYFADYREISSNIKVRCRMDAN